MADESDEQILISLWRIWLRMLPLEANRGSGCERDESLAYMYGGLDASIEANPVELETTGDV